MGHDGKDPKAGWHLEKAVISLPDDQKMWQFDCNRCAIEFNSPVKNILEVKRSSTVHYISNGWI